MHAAFFGLKRVHLRILAVSRSLLARVALTPARFDMIRIVELHTEGIPQRNIQYLLGVSAPTVSRMVKALEKLEWSAAGAGPETGDACTLRSPRSVARSSAPRASR